MQPLSLGLLCGLVFGLIAAAIVSRFPIENKERIMLAAFVNRFSIGLLIPVSYLGMSRPWSGMLIGFLLSIPPAMVEKKYTAPILAVGVIGGLIIGWIAD